MPKRKSKKTEVVATPENDRRQRPKWFAQEKQRILNEAAACTKEGELGALLHRDAQGFLPSGGGEFWRAL